MPGPWAIQDLSAFQLALGQNLKGGFSLHVLQHEGPGFRSLGPDDLEPFGSGAHCASAWNSGALCVLCRRSEIVGWSKGHLAVNCFKSAMPPRNRALQRSHGPAETL